MLLQRSIVNRIMLIANHMIYNVRTIFLLVLNRDNKKLGDIY